MFSLNSNHFDSHKFSQLRANEKCYVNVHDSLDNDCQGLAQDKISKFLNSVIDAVSSQHKLQPSQKSKEIREVSLNKQHFTTYMGKDCYKRVLRRTGKEKLKLAITLEIL